MNTTRSIKSTHAVAFTLLELLVSMAVMAIVLTVMFAALSTSMSLWRNTDGKITSDREARAVEVLLARDLASVVMPASTNLLPKIATNQLGRANVYYLKFLTAAPADIQSSSGSEVGDVCYVEYAVLPSTNGPGSEVRRLFWPSAKTFSDVIQRNAFPSAPQAATAYQSLGINLLPTNSMAARGLGSGQGALSQYVNNTNFMLLGTNMLPLDNSPGNYPVAIEVNFSVADRTTLANTNVIGLANYVLRNAGLYSFRLPLPKPPSVP